MKDVDGEGSHEQPAAKQLHAPLPGKITSEVSVSLPDTWQLAQLAALVGKEVADGEEAVLREHAESRTSLALEIWKAASRRIETERRLAFAEKFGDDWLLLAGSMTVAGQKLPSLPEWTGEDGVVPFSRFLELTVGLAKEEDRLRWWRAFYEQRLKQRYYQSQAVAVNEDSEFAKYALPVDEFVLPKGLLGSELERQRTFGIVAFPEGLGLALMYRRWRLSMSSSTKKAKNPHDLVECSKAARCG